MHPRARHRLTAFAGLVCSMMMVFSSTSAAEPKGESDPANDALFARVFQGRAPADRAPVALVLDGVMAGPTVLWLRAEGGPRVSTTPLLDVLVPKLRPEAGARVRQAARGDYIGLDALRALGFGVVYDEAELELRIDTPAQLTETVSHALGGSGVPPEAAGALAPSEVSGHINARGGGADAWTNGESPAVAAPLHLNLDSALRVHGWLLEGRADFAEAPAGAHRGDVLLSRDDPETAHRYLAGDFAVQPTGLQPSYPILGLGLTRSFALQPYRIIQPIGQFEFTLEQPSTVTVFVNGTLVQKLSLPAGRHDVRDLPLGPGVNDVELVIEDPSGVQRRMTFSSASAGELLAPGVSQYALSLGPPLVDDAGARTYALDRPVLSARRRWGALSMLTLGASFDGDVDRQRAGGELTLATTLGTLALDLGGSADRELGLGHAEGLRYDFARTGGRAQVFTLTLLGHHYSSGFRALGPATDDVFYSDDLALSASRRLPGAVFATLSGRVRVGRERPDATDASLRLSRSFGSVGVDGLLAGRRDGISPDEVRVLLSVRVNLPDGHGVVLASARTSNLEGPGSQASYSTLAGPPPGGVVTTVSVEETPETLRAGGAVSYTGNRLTSSVSTAGSVDRAHGWLTQTTAIEVGTGLAFADGVVAWSRPVSGSFVIVAKNPTVAEHDVQVNPALGGYAARADGFGPGVLPNLEPYRVATIGVDAPTLPSGYSLGPESHLVLPAYQSGTLVRVGDEGTVFLRGVLQHANGTPAAFALGNLVRTDGSSPPLIVMTNRAGRFSLMGVRPGRYELRLADPGTGPLVVDVPAGHTGLHSTGTLLVD